MTPFRFVTVIGGDGDKPLLPELLVALGDRLDEVTGELVDMTTACWYCSESAPKLCPAWSTPSK